MKVKILSSWSENWLQPELKLGDVEFTRHADCQDYDWLVVYDEIPRQQKVIDVHCPPEHTILVTQEPPIIKIQSPCYTRQFHYMLTTHSPEICRHNGYRRGVGALTGMTGHPFEELATYPERPKSKLISAVCSRKLMTKTEHSKRHHLFEYLLANLPDFSWKGQGIAPIDKKFEALDDFKYHVAVENITLDYHWTEKIADSIMSLCLTFYSGDPKLEEVLPANSFIRIPIDNPPKALQIIQNAIENNEYEKRLPAIIEARRLLVEKYNLYRQIIRVIDEHNEKHGASVTPTSPWKLYERHYMRKNPINSLGELIHKLRYKIALKKD